MTRGNVGNQSLASYFDSKTTQSEEHRKSIKTKKIEEAQFKC